MNWRNPFRWLVLLVLIVLTGLSLSVGLSWWGYEALTESLPALFHGRTEKVSSAHGISLRVKDMIAAEQMWRAHSRDADRRLWEDAGAHIDEVLGNIRETVYTTRGRELMAKIANARAEWKFGAMDDEDARSDLMSAALEFSEFQERRLEEDLATITGRVGEVLRQFGLASFLAGILAVAAVVMGARVISRSLLTTYLVLKSTANTVVIGDPGGRVVAVNPAFEHMTGLRGGDLVGKPLSTIGPTGRMLAESLRTGESKREQLVTWHIDDDATRYLNVDLLPWQNKRGRIVGGMAVLRDVTAHWQKQKDLAAKVDHLHELASYDAMTGLLNHRAFLEQFIIAMERARSLYQPLALVMIDLDFFKIYNDTLGHLQGDQLLEEYAEVLRKCVRTNDLVGRYGGDEFIVALEGADSTTASEVAERIRDTVATHPFKGREVLPDGRLTVSVGVAFFPSSARTCKDLIRRADTALYEAKRSHRNHVELYFRAIDDLRRTLNGDGDQMVAKAKALLTAIHSRDRYTFHHTEQVIRYVTWIGWALELQEDSMRKLRVSAFLHDIGKNQVPREILVKSEPLTKADWDKIWQHPVAGADLIRPVGSLAEVVPAVLHHHERWDGKGYPHRLAGQDIPLFARIVSVADSFDAMLSNRPYRDALSKDVAQTELKRMAGSQLDPSVVEAFLDFCSSRASRSRPLS